MSGDDHGHGGHGHDDGPSDIIPLGSWQDNFLALVAICALAGLAYFTGGYVQGIKVPEAHHGAHAEAATGGHAVGNGATPEHGAGDAAEHGTAGESASTGEHEIPEATSAGTAAHETSQAEATQNAEGEKPADSAAGEQSQESHEKDSAAESKDEAPAH